MQMKITIAFILLLFFSSCYVNKNVPLTKDIDKWPYGAQVAIRYSENTKIARRGEGYFIKGELLAVENDSLYILTYPPSAVVIFSKEELSTMIVAFSLTSDAPNKFSGWTALLCLSTLAHGYFAVFSLPLNLIVGANVAASAAQSTFAALYPDNISWDELKKFSRFPQGIPEGVNPATLFVRY
jgi:hypothetical protein